MRIREFIASRFPLARPFELGDDVSLLDAGVIDSLGVLDILAFLERTFGLRITDDDLKPDNFVSVGAMARFVERKR